MSASTAIRRAYREVTTRREGQPMSVATDPNPPQDRIVAYLHPELAGVLLCPEHSEEYPGSIPLAPGDLPDGGYCSHGTPDGHVCGRAFPMKKRTSR
ncbi:hypothetical protein EES39_40890 [Streptomyces sp. ADI92-24]|uniref:hypothetical protein n=1 Tax=unclassified Streptomyces TaxID=2593676 RepID=UPI000F48DD78|nr:MULTISPECIES: hypothetical protein [unclassified Streptomyces]ROQ72541.1 hypothetical protein EDD95_5118 [Streptomyces sp. CEV 2-1]RPK29000.1 hypothetical protein EES39_40890 [Streptomyces sp. ADI92-24]